VIASSKSAIRKTCCTIKLTSKSKVPSKKNSGVHRILLSKFDAIDINKHSVVSKIVSLSAVTKISRLMVLLYQKTW
jgi:hypothetical protein